MKTHISILLGSLCLILLSPPIRGLAATASLTVAEDTFINSGNPGNNAGGTGWLDAGRDGAGGIRRGLLRFDLSSIPAGSTVTSATLQLSVVKVPGSGPVNSTFDLFRLLASWRQGNKGGNNGAPATTGEPTWNARMLGTANWTVARGQERCGGDPQRLDSRRVRRRRQILLERVRLGRRRAALGE